MFWRRTAEWHRQTDVDVNGGGRDGYVSLYSFKSTLKYKADFKHEAHSGLPRSFLNKLLSPAQPELSPTTAELVIVRTD